MRLILTLSLVPKSHQIGLNRGDKRVFLSVVIVAHRRITGGDTLSGFCIRVFFTSQIRCHPASGKRESGARGAYITALSTFARVTRYGLVRLRTRIVRGACVSERGEETKRGSWGARGFGDADQDCGLIRRTVGCSKAAWVERRAWKANGRETRSKGTIHPGKGDRVLLRGIASISQGMCTRSSGWPEHGIKPAGCGGHPGTHHHRALPIPV